MIKKPPKDFKEVIENHYRLRIEQIEDNISRRGRRDCGSSVFVTFGL